MPTCQLVACMRHPTPFQINFYAQQETVNSKRQGCPLFKMTLSPNGDGVTLLYFFLLSPNRTVATDDPTKTDAFHGLTDVGPMKAASVGRFRRFPRRRFKIPAPSRVRTPPEPPRFAASRKILGRACLGPCRVGALRRRCRGNEFGGVGVVLV